MSVQPSVPAAQEVAIVDDGGLGDLGIDGSQNVDEVSLDPSEAATWRVAVTYRPGDGDGPGLKPDRVEQAEQFHGAVVDLHLACGKRKTDAGLKSVSSFRSALKTHLFSNLKM